MYRRKPWYALHSTKKRRQCSQQQRLAPCASLTQMARKTRSEPVHSNVTGCSLGHGDTKHASYTCNDRQLHPSVELHPYGVHSLKLSCTGWRVRGGAGRCCLERQPKATGTCHVHRLNHARE